MQKRFVNVIASVDLERGGGKILYVNPSSGSDVPSVGQGAVEVPRSGSSSGAARYEIVAQDATGAELTRQPAQLQLSSCAPGEKPTSAMVAQDILLVEGTTRLALQRDGETIADYEAGQSLKARGVAPEMHSMGVAPPAPGAPHRRPLEFDEGEIQPEAGVTYTVQVQPDASGPWQTIVLGQARPDANIDARQFPGAKMARIRVLRTTGFEDEVIAEREVELGSD